MYMKLCLFRKKDQLHSLIIFEVIRSEKYSYFNLQKQLFQNNLQEWVHSQVPNTAKAAWQEFYHNFLLIQDKFSWETFL